MLFNSFPFIFVFLPITFAGYFLVGRLFEAPWPRLVWLAAASLAFYAYWNVHFLPVIIVSIAVNYVAARLISATGREERRRTALFAGAVILNLAAICFYKYLGFLTVNVSGLFHLHLHHRSIALPLGISFFTFTQIAYLADIYGGYKCERSLVKYALFVSYFPHLIAGPIIHHKEVMWQFDDKVRRILSAERVSVGLTAFAAGLFKKTVLADGFATLADPLFASAAGGVPPTADAWIGVLAYSLQIYFDFSAYSDMAVGLSTLFGITLPFNFDSPYKSMSIIEFWHRWHITLSRFLRDYLYIPLGGNRRGDLRRHVNILATMALGGLWHGAGWVFMIWGTLHGIFLVINHLWRGLRARLPRLDRTCATPIASIGFLLLTQFCVVLAWVPFRSNGIKMAKRVLSGMFGAHHATAAASFADPGLMLLLVALGYLWCILLPNLNQIFERRDLGLTIYPTPRAWSAFSVAWRPTVAWGIGLGLVTMVALLAILKSGQGTPFLYFQF